MIKKSNIKTFIEGKWNSVYHEWSYDLFS